jgi:hypothetical protein
MTTLTTADRAAFDAAHDALQPYTQHAQTRAAIAAHIAATARNYHSPAADVVAWDNWPADLARISRPALHKVMQAAIDATNGSN